MSVDVICLCVCLSQKICKSIQFLLILSDSFCACEGPTGVQVPVVLASASMAIGSGFRVKGFGFAPVISPSLSVHYVLTIIHCRLGSFHSSLRQRQSEAESNEGNKTNETTDENRNECHHNVIECPRGSGKTKTLGEQTTFGENKVWKI